MKFFKLMLKAEELLFGDTDLIGARMNVPGRMAPVAGRDFGEFYSEVRVAHGRMLTRYMVVKGKTPAAKAAIKAAWTRHFMKRYKVPYYMAKRASYAPFGVEMVTEHADLLKRFDGVVLRPKSDKGEDLRYWFKEIAGTNWEWSIPRLLGFVEIVLGRHWMSKYFSIN